MSTIHHALEANVLAPIIGQPKVEFTREAEAGIRPVFELNADLRSVQSIREAIPQKLIEFEKFICGRLHKSPIFILLQKAKKV